MSAMVITIDGPAASGKSSVSRELARRLGWSWLSTGSFYRGLAYVARETKTDLTSSKALAALAVSPIWKIEMGLEQTSVIFENRDVSEFIHSEDVGGIASKISNMPEVRAALLEPQRQFAKEAKRLIAEGRDCGTVVFPDAIVKVYLTASSESRALRRATEHNEGLEKIIQAQKTRDQQDSTRKAAPLTIPQNALVLDTSELNLTMVVDKVEAYARALVK